MTDKKADPTKGSNRYEYTGETPLTLYAPGLGATVCLSKDQVIDTDGFGPFPVGRHDFKKVSKTAKLTAVGDMVPPAPAKAPEGKGG